MCDGLRTPITIGIVHGKMILSAVAWEDKKMEDILRHELNHVRAKDNLVKVILYAYIKIWQGIRERCSHFNRW